MSQTVGERLTAVNLQINKLVETGVRRYKTGLSEVEKALMSDLQVERAYLVDLKKSFGLSYVEDADEITPIQTNGVSFV